MPELDENKNKGAQLFKFYFQAHWRGFMIVLLPLFLSIIFLALGTENKYRCLFLVLVMASYWICEAMPLYVTSLLPIFYFPITGIVSSMEVCEAYFKDALAMFLVGLMFANAIEYCNLHKRVALKVILIVGCSPRRLHFGLITVILLVSLWISNSACTAMMCPIVRATLEELQAQGVVNIYRPRKPDADPDDKPEPSNIALAFYLTAAYASTIGGCGTLIGTGTNLVFKGLYDTHFPHQRPSDELEFANFFYYCFPMTVIGLLGLYLILEFTHMGLWRKKSQENKEIAEASKQAPALKTVIREKYKELGPMSAAEIQVSVVFFVMIVLLFSKSPGFIKGWHVISSEKIKSTPVMTFVVLLFFALPKMYTFFKYYYKKKGVFTKGPDTGVLDWPFVNETTSWGLFFLLGGGFALSLGSNKSGMAKWLGEGLSGLKTLPVAAIQFIVILITMFATAFSSNVAIANIVVPIVAEMARSMEIHPLLLIFPAGLTCSMAFFLPVSTPPNAIVAAVANIKTKYMLVAGIGPSIMEILIIMANSNSWHYVIFRDSSFPDSFRAPPSSDS